MSGRTQSSFALKLDILPRPANWAGHGIVKTSDAEPRMRQAECMDLWMHGQGALWLPHQTTSKPTPHAKLSTKTCCALRLESWPSPKPVCSLFKTSCCPFALKANQTEAKPHIGGAQPFPLLPKPNTSRRTHGCKTSMWAHSSFEGNPIGTRELGHVMFGSHAVSG